MSNNELYAFGVFRVDPLERFLTRDGVPVSLPSKAFDTLLYLIENPERVLGKDELIAAIWPGRIVEEGNLSQNIFLLRKALSSAGEQDRFIVTVPGRGYRFTSPVLRVARGTLPETDAIPGSPAVQSEGQAEVPDALLRLPKVPSLFAGFKRSHIYALLGILLLFSIGYLVLERTAWRRTVPVAAAAASSAPGKSVAVLPFENLSGDPQNAYFTDGVRDEILTKLAALNDLKVISRTSADLYKSRPQDLKTVAAELGVGAVLEGSVQMSGDIVRVNVQLIDAQTDRHLWAQSYDRTAVNLFAAEGEVALAIANTLHARLTAGEAGALPAAPTTDLQAYDSLLKGEAHLRRVHSTFMDDTREYHRAAEFFDDAVRRDPLFAQAQAELAYALINGNDDHSPGQYGRAKAAIDRALSLAPDSAPAHLAYGYYYYYFSWDAAAAEVEFQRVIALQPQNVEARLGLSLVERRLGHWQRAAEWQEEALPLDPRNVDLLLTLHLTRALSRDFAGALEMSNRVLAIEPDNVRAARQSASADLAGFGDSMAALRVLDAVPASHRNDAILVQVRFDVLMFQRQFVAACDLAATMPEPDYKWFNIARCRTGLHDRVAAQAAYRQVLKIFETAEPAGLQDLDYLANRVKILAGLGRTEEAIGLSDKVEAIVSAPDFPHPVDGVIARGDIAEAYAMINRPAEAIQRIRQLLGEPAGVAVTIPKLKLDPAWDPIRNDPGFQQLIADGDTATLVQAAQPVLGH